MKLIEKSPYLATTEKKGFFMVKQPSLVSTGTFLIPETILGSPDEPLNSFLHSSAKKKINERTLLHTYEKEQVLAMNKALKESIANIKIASFSSDP